MSVLQTLKFGFSRRLPVVLQAEAAECGMACLAMLLGYYGREIDLIALRRRHSLSLKGMTLRNLVDLAGSMDSRRARFGSNSATSAGSRPRASCTGD